MTRNVANRILPLLLTLALLFSCSAAAARAADEDDSALWGENYLGAGQWERVPLSEWQGEAYLQLILFEKKAALEHSYGVTIDLSLVNTLSLREIIGFLDYLAEGLGTLPDALNAGVQAVLSAQGRTPLIVLNPPVSYSHLSGEYSRAGDVITIYRYDDPRIVVHEYSHMLYALLREQSGDRVISDRLSALNGGAFYADQLRDPLPAVEEGFPFLTEYAKKSAAEDFAETVSYLLACPSALWALGEDGSEDSVRILQKADYLRGVLLTSFSLRETDLYDTAPPRPSVWVADGVARYQALFGSRMFDFAPSGAPIYQSSTPRAAFAFGAYDLADKLCRDRENASVSAMVLPAPAAGEPDAALWESVKRLNPFRDMTAAEVVVLHRMGVINGRSEQLFDPDGRITREEAAAMLCRLCTAMGYDMTAVTPVEPVDAADCSPWALDSIRAVCGAGIMNGVGGGVFDPKGTYTYEQSILTLVRAYDLLDAAGRRAQN